MFLASVASTAAQKTVYEVPLGGNTYYDEVNRANAAFAMGWGKDKSLRLDAEVGLSATTYVYFTEGQVPRVALRAEGKGEVSVCVDGGKATVVKIGGNKPKDYKLGSFRSGKDGYMAFRYSLRGNGSVKIHSLIVDGVDKAPIYLLGSTNTYFGLRGPSCHLNYQFNSKSYGEVEWATICLTVPKECDQEGSYYMALGFGGGYFGIQNNGRGRRQALFSLWNTEDADDPKVVANENKVTVMAHGDGVTARDFGNEGSGKQSFIDVGWLPDVTYRFLLHAARVDSATVDYSAWFYDSVKGEWQYMSTLRRPKTKVLITGLHSFLENFDPTQGNKTRKAYYHNAWARTADGVWRPLQKAFLTCDDTGNRGRRLDFNGGVEQGRFFLTNGGYFDRPEEVGRFLSADDDAYTMPDIDLTQFDK